MKFLYEAKTRGGLTERGETEAADERAAAALLREKGLTPLEIASAREFRGGVKISFPAPFASRVKLAEKTLFFRELATMTEAGVPAAASLKILSEQKRSRRFGAVISDIYARVAAGSTLAAAFAGHSDCFGAVAVALVRAGEESGTLDKSLAKIASFLEAREELRRKIISALTYPALVASVAVFSLCVMAAVVVPQFERAFRGLGVELPPLTRAVFRAGAWMESRWHVLLFAFLLLVLAAKLALRSAGFRAYIDGAMLKFPIFGDMLLKAALSRSFGTMGVLLRAGLPALVSLRLAASAAGNEKIRKAFETARDGAAAGKGLSAALESCGVFPRMIIHMAAVGEETGRSAEMFGKIADWYESELSDKVRRLSSILEPVLVVIVGAAVGIMAVAVFIPVVSAINSFI